MKYPPAFLCFFLAPSFVYIPIGEHKSFELPAHKALAINKLRHYKHYTVDRVLAELLSVKLSSNSLLSPATVLPVQAILAFQQVILFLFLLLLFIVILALVLSSRHPRVPVVKRNILVR